MNVIAQAFERKKPFIGFVVAGDGGMDYSIQCCLNMLQGGVDMLEIGLPFSDPIGDGPVIQKGAGRSLQQKTTPSMILEMAKILRKDSLAPLILFTYYNPLLQQGNAYLSQLKSAGFDGVLVIDLPPPDPFFQSLEEAGLTPIFVISPSTEESRIEEIARLSQGFLYYACQKGTTGVRKELPPDLKDSIQKIRCKTKIPVAIGFGIANRESAASALSLADGFVVGSAFVKLMELTADPREIQKLAHRIDPRHE